MDAGAFLRGLSPLGIDLYTGVPDSLLKPFCHSLYALYGAAGKHIVAANEGAAAGLAAGHYIATGRPALVYLQNSGLGNMANPMISLLHEKVYGIPCVFVVGWRGEPGVPDEPQHVYQGEITREMLALMGLETFLLSRDTDEASFAGMVKKAKAAVDGGRSVAFLVKKGALTGGESPDFPQAGTLSREEALEIILSLAPAQDVFVCTTGKASREVYELREKLGQGHDRDFLTVGSMGHAGMIALGIARARPDAAVWCLDGDGAALMHLGSLAVEAGQACPNLRHVVLSNGAHESVGGMPVCGGGLSFAPLAKALGFPFCKRAEDEAGLRQALKELRTSAGGFLEVALRPGARDNLGRPKSGPKENLRGLMASLGAKV